MIRAVKLDAEDFPLHNIEGGGRKLDKLSKLNFFVGANNSGKSKLLRTLFSSKNKKIIPEGIEMIKLSEVISSFTQEVQIFFVRNDMVSYGPVDVNEIGKLEMPEYFDCNFDFKIDIIDKIKILTSIGTFRTSNATTSHEFSSRLKKIANNTLSKLNELITNDNFRYFNEDKYIPTLRGLRSLNSSNEDFYLARTIKDYFEHLKINVSANIYSGLGLYNDCKRLLLGNTESRQKMKDFERFLSETFFSNAEVNIIPNVDDHVVHIRIDDDEYPVYELGDGIQSIIVLMYPMFFNQGKTTHFYIEEPEQFLHPGFQRIFLEALNRYEFRDFQYFITTHSNHLLDLSMDIADVSIYTLQKLKEREETFTIQNVRNDDLSILDLLGVRKSSVFLSNCTIWVEGITDRIYLRKYIDVYQKAYGHQQFTEDIHYSFVEFGGNNITHWSFLDSEDPEHNNIQVKRICNRLFLITDSDGEKRGMEEEKVENGTKKAARHLMLKENLGENYYRLSCREIENLLVPTVIKQVVVQWEGKELDFTNFSMTKYVDEPLGTYIDTVVPELTRKYGDKSGTVKNKVEFAKRAVNEIADVNGLSKEAKLVAKKLYDFIASHNA
ncbi:MAG: AAA family ATPase [Pedobacter sp.]|nr:AAA family ATPase [Pedobacter sp.]